MEENKEIKKTNNKITILIIVVLGLALCVGSFFLGQALANKEDEIVNKENKEEVNGEEPANKEEEKEEEKTEISFDRTKCINCKFAETDVIEVKGTEEFDFMSHEFNSDDHKKITISAQIWDEGYKSYEFIFDKKVVDVFYSGLAWDLTHGAMVFFLLEDGTVEYIRYFDMLEGKKRKLTIKDIDGIVKFNNLVVDDELPASTELKIIAYKSDGTYYALDDLVEMPTY